MPFILGRLTSVTMVLTLCISGSFAGNNVKVKQLQRKPWSSLGTVEVCSDECVIPPYTQDWADLSEEAKVAAEALKYTDEIWDADRVPKGLNKHIDSFWDDVPAEIRSNLKSIGLNEGT